MKNKQSVINIAVLVVVALLCTITGVQYKSLQTPDPINTSNPGITEIKMLSDYSPGLKGTASDVEVYVLKGEKPGGSLLILGGTHPNEIAGMFSAVTYIENAKVTAGTVYVIPRANNSGFTHTAPLWAGMPKVDFTLSDGSVREFRVGTRLTNPVHQWPDYNYYNGASGRVLKTGEVAEMRNLNRNHPGNVNGTLTEKANYGIFNLINSEKVDIVYDAHEAGPAFLRVNYMIAHDRAMPLASSAMMNANIEGFDLFKVDLSGKTSYGLSHRALGDNTEVFATLFETNNPAQGMLRGKLTRELVLEGKNANDVEITKRGLMSSGEVTEEGNSIEQRTGYHMVAARELANAFSEMYPNKPITITGMPSYDDLIGKGLNNILKPIK